MTEHVVQFAGDAQPLVARLPARLLRARASGLGLGAGHLGEVKCPHAYRFGERDRRRDERRNGYRFAQRRAGDLDVADPVGAIARREQAQADIGAVRRGATRPHRGARGPAHRREECDQGCDEERATRIAGQGVHDGGGERDREGDQRPAAPQKQCGRPGEEECVPEGIERDGVGLASRGEPHADDLDHPHQYGEERPWAAPFAPLLPPLAALSPPGWAMRPRPAGSAVHTSNRRRRFHPGHRRGAGITATPTVVRRRGDCAARRTRGRDRRATTSGVRAASLDSAGYRLSKGTSR